MKKSTTHESQEVMRPIQSLIGKSEKACRKLMPGTWQHTMLQENLRALHLASALMSGEAGVADDFTREELQAALRSLAKMIDKSENAQVKFAQGTAHHTLQGNRIRALRAAETWIAAELA